MKRLTLSCVTGAVALALLSGAALSQGRQSIRPQDPNNPLRELISGYYFANVETRALQDDDFDNPGFLWVEQGAQLWTTPQGSTNKACSDCHGNAEETMRGVGARYPAYDKKLGRVINIEQRIQNCQRKNQGAEPWKWESRELLSMTAYVKHFSRGLPVNVTVSGPARPWFERGREFFYKRRGQLNLSCAHCHEYKYGSRLRSDLLSQGHLNGFPVYRLKWGTLGSTHRRFRGCNKLIRSTPFPYGSDEYMALELYITWRGNGLPVESPSVRR